eukprot:TRINITY_DN5501_c0_g1_i2.p1 TRINITY_DN5501_c0_g1~~TRINITY_DN5501_c0_g1_i2.p1  ORF type:complete len:579 (+),score=163.19 TRINITY_DN5501_c0_g1_i2:240-1976(+)
MVTSSTGDGEPPDNAASFWRFLRTKKKDDFNLQAVQFALLGLGDSNYDTFMGFPNNLHQKLLELGAKEFFRFGRADDATGLEDVVEPWINDLWTALDSSFRSPSPSPTPSEGQSDPKKPKKFKIKPQGDKPPETPSVVQFLDALPQEDLTPSPSSPPYSKDNPYLAPILSSKLLTSPSATKQVLQLSLSYHEQLGLSPGDAIGVLPPNPLPLVNALISRLGVPETRPFLLVPHKVTTQHIKTPCTITTALTCYCNITALPSRLLLRTLAEYAEDKQEKEELLLLCDNSVVGKKMYAELMEKRVPSLLELLNRWTSVKIPLGHLLEVLPPQSARYYSISDFPLKKREEIKIALTIVNNNLVDLHGDTKEFKGVCSNWLFGLTKMDSNSKEEQRVLLNGMKMGQPNQLSVPIFPREQKFFRYPEDVQRPVIMVAAGTGVSPFVGFIEFRRYLVSQGKGLGKCSLYYGCRHPERDFLYPELNDYAEEKAVDLHVCYSQLNPSTVKEYVQHLLYKNGEEVLNDMIHHNAILFVCGESSGMIKGVREQLILALQNYKEMSVQQAEETLKQWTNNKQYMLDIWT